MTESACPVLKEAGRAIFLRRFDNKADFLKNR